MDLFDGHCDTMTRCYRYGYGIRENFGNQDLKRDADAETSSTL